MKATIGNTENINEEPRELARRTGDGVDVALLWDAGTDRVFVVVDDERRGERFRIAVGNSNALDAFHHPYAYRSSKPEYDAFDLTKARRAA